MDLAGTNLLSTLPAQKAADHLANLGTAYAPGLAGPLKVTLRLADPARLYARQRARASGCFTMIFPP